MTDDDEGVDPEIGGGTFACRAGGASSGTLKGPPMRSPALVDCPRRWWENVLRGYGGRSPTRSPTDLPPARRERFCGLLFHLNPHRWL
jgi:hypothetical protein